MGAYTVGAAEDPEDTGLDRRTRAMAAVGSQPERRKAGQTASESPMMTRFKGSPVLVPSALVIVSGCSSIHFWRSSGSVISMISWPG